MTQYTLADKSDFAEAMVDGITIVVGGKPTELTEDQVKRLKDAGVKLKEVNEDGTEANPSPPKPVTASAGAAISTTGKGSE